MKKRLRKKLGRKEFAPVIVSATTNSLLVSGWEFGKHFRSLLPTLLKIVDGPLARLERELEKLPHG